LSVIIRERLCRSVINSLTRRKRPRNIKLNKNRKTFIFFLDELLTGETREISPLQLKEQTNETTKQFYGFDETR